MRIKALLISKLLLWFCFQEPIFPQIEIESQVRIIEVDGQYLGQSAPGSKAEIFAPGIVSTCMDELNSVFTPNMLEFYFSVRNLRGNVSIFQMTLMEGEWTSPSLLSCAMDGDIDIMISPDGNSMLFSSKRRINQDSAKHDYDLWKLERTKNSWFGAKHLGIKINSNAHDFYPVISKYGNIFFSSQREGTATNNIYISKIEDGEYQYAKKLGKNINTQYREFDPYISPYEDILIFASDRTGGYGNADLYISFKDASGEWTKAINLGHQINTEGMELSPWLSPDKKYLFFTRAIRVSSLSPNPLHYRDFESIFANTENGFGDIYWVNAGIITELRDKYVK